jgi:hypothetical protein
MDVYFLYVLSINLLTINTGLWEHDFAFSVETTSA